MNLTVGMFEACVAQMDPLRAERILDMAQAAAAVHAKQDWWDALIARAQGAKRAVAQAGGFMFNGAAVSFDGLFRRLSSAIGGGVSN